MYALLAMGIYISFRILNTPDLTAEGSFTFGVVVSTVIANAGYPMLAIVAGFAAGILAGIVTGELQTRVGIHPIVAGIITMTGLYSINLAVLGGAPNLSMNESIFKRLFGLLPQLPTKATDPEAWANKELMNQLRAQLNNNKEMVETVVALVFCVAAFFALVWFFRTHLGLCIRATGNNDAMVRSSSINSDQMRVIGIAISNGFIGLSGAIVAQNQGYGDVSSGVGILVVGLASVIIGEAIFGRRSVMLGFLSAIVGSLVYRFIYALALQIPWLPPYFLRLISAVIVAVSLAIPKIADTIRKRAAVNRAIAEHKKEVEENA